MTFGRSSILPAAFFLLVALAPVTAPAQELFGVNVVVVPQNDSPVRIRQLNIGEGEDQGSPEIILENHTGRVVDSVAFSTWMAQPQNCYDESRTPRPPSETYTILLFKPLLPHSTTTLLYSGNPSFLRADLPLRDLMSHAPTHTVGYAHVQVAIESVGFRWDEHLKNSGWQRKHPNRRGLPWPFNQVLFNHSVYRQDRPDCEQWQAIVPLLHKIGGTDILLKDPFELTNTGAGVLRSGEGGYFYTCAFASKPEGSAFVCPNLSAPQKHQPGHP
jgi:hypothetical protein